MTIKNIRTYNKWSLEIASKLFNIKPERLKNIEDYKEAPTYDEVVTILKMAGVYYDDMVGEIYNDFDSHYRHQEVHKFLEAEKKKINY